MANTMITKANWVRRFFGKAADWVFGYDYFISYAWKDGREYALALAVALQDRGFHVFIDDTGFRRGEDLRVATPRALGRSRELILVLTPAAAVSSYVLDEVRRFAALRRFIVPIDVRSTGATLRTDNPLNQIITPFTLRIADPCDDIRERPTAGVVDEIQNSIRHTRQDRLRANIAGAVAVSLAVLLCAAVVTGGLAVIQRNRAEANAQTARAKFAETRDMAQFLLSELVETLRPVVGAQEVRNALLRKSHEQLAVLIAEQPADPEISTGVAMLQAIRGEIGQAIGDYAAAESDFETAIPILLVAYRGDPENDRLTSILNRALPAASMLYRQVAQLDKAARANDDFREFAEARAASAPDSPEAVQAVAIVRLDRCELLKLSGDYKSAREECTRALEQLSAFNVELVDLAKRGWPASPRSPALISLLQTRADCHQLLGALEWVLSRDNRASGDWLRKALEDREILASAYPTNYAVLVELATLYGLLCTKEDRAGDAAQARFYARRGYELALRLTTSEPQRLDGWVALDDLTGYLSMIAERDGEFTQARAYAEECQQIWRRLRILAPMEASYLLSEAVADFRVAGFLRGAGDTTVAMQMLMNAQQKLEDLTSRYPTNLSYSEALATARIRIAKDKLSDGELDGAGVAAEAAAGMMPRILEQHAGDSGWQRRAAELHQVRATIAMRNGDFGVGASEAEMALKAYTLAEPAASKLNRDVNVFRVRSVLEYCLLHAGRKDEAETVREANAEVLESLEAAAQYDPIAARTARDHYLVRQKDYVMILPPGEQLELLKRAGELNDQLLALRSEDTDALVVVLDVAMRSGLTALALGDLSAAQVYFEDCVKHAEAQGRGMKQLEYASYSLWHLIDGARRTNPPRYESALHYATRRLELDEIAVASDPSNASLRFRRATSLLLLCSLKLEAGDLADAEDYGNRGIREARSLAESNPMNGLHVGLLVDGLHCLARLRKEQKRDEEGTMLEREAMQKREQMTGWPGAPAFAFVDYANALLGAQFPDPSDVGLAVAAARRAVAMTYSRDSNSLSCLGECLFRQGDVQGARKCVTSALSLVPPEQAAWRQALEQQLLRYEGEAIDGRP